MHTPIARPFAAAGLILVGFAMAVNAQTEPPATSALVHPGPDGRLVYQPYTEPGDTIPDFSYAGYARSEKPIPDLPVVVTLQPLAGEAATDGSMAYPTGPDSHQRIQSALDAAAARQPDADGFRGAVLLKKGTYYVHDELVIRSGVVLRGEGDDADGTVLIFRDTPLGIRAGAAADVVELGEPAPIADAYVPAGSMKVTVADASAFQPGDTVDVRKTPNDQWIRVLKMDQLTAPGSRPWRAEAYRITHVRTITGISGNTITLDAPLPQSIAAEHGGGLVQAVDLSEMDRQCGVESLRVVANYDTSVKDDNGFADETNNLRHGIMLSCIDGWARDCTVMHTSRTSFSFAGNALYCTVRDCRSLEPVSVIRGGRRYAFSIVDASLCLVYRCFSEKGRHDYVVGSRESGPNAFVLSEARDAYSVSEPHHRWGTGILYDNIVLKNGGALQAVNRGDSGSGHGWAGANVVFWNCNAKAIVVMDPPTSEQNFAIGYSGPLRDSYPARYLRYANRRGKLAGTPDEVAPSGFALMGNGYIEHPQRPVTPTSLFVRQLIDRIGQAKAAAVLE